jgi:galactokinase
METKLGEKLTFLVASLGRINLIGEHTDYNLGYSVPSAINKYVFVQFVKLANCDKSEKLDFSAELISLDYDESYTVTEVKKMEVKSWVNYALGVIDRFGQIQECLMGRYRMVITGNLGIDLGISSSSALCCGVAYSMNKLLDANLSLDDLAHVAQWSEHHYIGTKGGLLDQTAILFSKDSTFIKVDFLTSDRTFYQVPFPMSVILLHSGEYHCLSETCYNKRVTECKEAVHLILKAAGKTIAEPVTLRECDLDDLYNAEVTLDPTLFKRAKYVIEENL